MAGELEFLVRPALRAWWRLHRGMTLGVRGIAQDEMGRIALVRHTYVAGWHLPGGGVESGQTAEAAMRAEFAEEAGVTLDEPPELLGVYCHEPFFKNDHILLYRARTWRRAPPPRATREIAECGWFAPDALPEAATPSTRRRLAEVYENAARDSYW
jgi:8-oxo-dGTP pyrophosphatase MutT (NUDIX family)